MKLDILAIGAHPDDVELGCGGVIAKEVLLGRKVGIIDLTQGELGTRGDEHIRAVEAANAAKILKINTRVQLGFADGFFVNDKIHQFEVIKIIRKYQPEIVLCNAVDDRHPDHGKGSRLVSDACFLSGLGKVDTAQSAWRPKCVYHYIQWKNPKPDVIVDISDVIHIKLQAVKAYTSQFYNPDSLEPETPISGKNFLESISYRSQDLGRLIGVTHGEGFIAERPIATQSLNDLI